MTQKKDQPKDPSKLSPEQMLQEVHAAMEDSQHSFSELREAVARLGEIVQTIGAELQEIKHGWHDTVIAALKDIEESGDAAALACNADNEVEEPAAPVADPGKAGLEPAGVTAASAGDKKVVLSNTPHDNEPGWEKIAGKELWQMTVAAPGGK